MLLRLLTTTLLLRWKARTRRAISVHTSHREDHNGPTPTISVQSATGHSVR